MKKITVFLVVLLIGAILLTSCGTNSPTTTAPAQTSNTPTATSGSTTTAPPTTTNTGTTTTTPTAPPTSSTQPTASPTATPVVGGRLELATSTDIVNLGDPYEPSNPTDAMVAFTSLEGLLTIDSKGDLQPMLATSWDIAPDGSSVTFHLRKGVKFQDGSDFNAETAAFDMNMRMNSQVYTNFHSISGVTIDDPYTITIRFKNGHFDWTVLYSLATFWQGMEFSEQALKTESPEYLREHPVGTGPFELAQYDQGQDIKFNRFDDYWGGKPYLDGVDFKIMPDTTTQLLAFKTGEIDSLLVQPQDAASIKATGAQVIETNNGTWNIAIAPDSNNPDSPFAKLQVRQAFEYAIDKETIANELGYGYWHASYQPFLPGMAVYNSDITGYNYDVAKAKQLLAEAGYPNGFKTTILMADVMPDDWVLAVQDQLKAVGIDMALDKESLTQLNTKVTLGWNGLAVTALITGPTSDPGQSLAQGPLSGNTTWKSNNEPQDALDLATQAASELDVQKRTQDYQQISKILEDDAQWCYIYYGTNIYAISPKIQGATFGQGMFAWTHAWKEQ